MRKKSRMMVAAASVASLSLPAGAPLSAQLANASAATLGVGGNATATARGFGAISVNPAGLGMPGAGFSLAVIPVTLRQGLGPVTLGNLHDLQGRLVPAGTKEDWLARVVSRGRQIGSVGAEVSEVAFTTGHMGFQLSTLLGGSMDLSPDLVEALLYGNAGRTGSPEDLSLSGSTVSAFGVTTAGLSLGRPLTTSQGDMAVGITLKYSVGHVVAVGRDQGGSVQSDPLRVDVDFPLLTFDEDGEDFNNGTGIGVDVGFQLERDRLSFGAAVLNAFNTFAWSEANLVYRPGTAVLEDGNSDTDFDKKPVAEAPAAIRRTLDEMQFDPTISVGAAYDVNEDFTVSGDVRNRFGDGMSLTPKLHAGLGAEYRGIDVLHLRAGAAVLTEGFQLGGGASLILGPVSVSFAAAIQRGDLEDTSIGQFSLSFGGH